MRIAIPQVTLIEPAAHPLVFAGTRGERFQISVLEDDVIRVQLLPDGKPRQDRTWLVVGQNGDAPREGRRRDDLSPFSLPPFSREVRPNRVHIITRQLRVAVALDDLRLMWADAQGNHFAADLTGRAYPYDRASQAIFHYLERRPGEHYYGFGERAGPLDKAGMRMRMLNLDALVAGLSRLDDVVHRSRGCAGAAHKVCRFVRAASNPVRRLPSIVGLFDG